MSQWYITQTERKATLTDFSLASRCYYDNNAKTGAYYIRSIGDSTSHVCCINIYGYVYNDYAPTYEILGVRPAFDIQS